MANDIDNKIEQIIKHLNGLSRVYKTLKDENARLKARLDEFEKHEKSQQMTKRNRLKEIHNILVGAPNIANIMLAMNLLMAVDISNDGKKSLYELYVEIQSAMLFMDGRGPNIKNWQQDLLIIIRNELGEGHQAARLALESKQKQLASPQRVIGS